MANKAVIITGGARRIGAALALHFAEHGYDIALHYNHSKKDAGKLQAQIKKRGVKCELFSHDLKNIKGIPALMKKIRAAMPHCVALINNASIFERAEFMKTDEALFDRQFAVNFKAPFFLTQAFAKTFGKGCVINMIDTDIAKVRVSHFAYLLSKKALADFTPMAARALGPKIRVNGVCPGCILPSSHNDKVYEKKMAAQIPLKGHPSLNELAEAVRWLTEQQHITAQVIYVDGGQHVL
jgi:NAD(P)-dependent dehydrogenase (short-subunit alcohol dehydrogenase family)